MMLTLEEKVGQVLMPCFIGEVVNEEAQALIQKSHVGGVIYYNWANGLTSPTQVKTLSAGLQALANIPLFIAVDQEGGRVARLKEGFTAFSSNQDVAMTGNSNLACENAKTMGKEMLGVGVNMNLAPVVDVNNNPHNPVIGNRSYGSTPEIVIRFGQEALKGYHEAGVITCLKHFPGHGDVTVDSHKALPVINKPIEELEKVELAPFKALASKTDAIMTGHLLVPSLDSDNPATLSKKTLTYLRQLGFEGVIVSDSLVMQGVLDRCVSIDEAAIQALNAGCDLLILGGKILVGTTSTELKASDVQRVHQSLVKAVKEGRIEQARLDDAVIRVLKLKRKMKLPCH